MTPRRLTRTTSPDRDEGKDNDCRPPAHHGEEVDDRTGKGNGDHRQRRPDRNPVAPRDEEAGEVAVGQAGVGVGPAGCRRQSRQPGEGQAKTDRPCTHHDPDQNGQVAIRSDSGGRQIEARPDHVADHNGRARRHPEALAALRVRTMGHARTRGRHALRRGHLCSGPRLACLSRIRAPGGSLVPGACFEVPADDRSLVTSDDCFVGQRSGVPSRNGRRRRPSAGKNLSLLEHTLAAPPPQYSDTPLAPSQAGVLSAQVERIRRSCLAAPPSVSYLRVVTVDSQSLTFDQLVSKERVATTRESQPSENPLRDDALVVRQDRCPSSGRQSSLPSSCTKGQRSRRVARTRSESSKN